MTLKTDTQITGRTSPTMQSSFFRHGRPLFAVMLALVSTLAFFDDAFAARPNRPDVIDLGDERLQIGNIVIDSKARSFSVPGRVLGDRKMLEYLLIKKNGSKAYESIIEADTTASEFNLACILIRLNRNNAVPPRHHFDRNPAQGDAVEIRIEWGEGPDFRSVRAEDIFLVSGKPVPASKWVYTGSFMLPRGVFLAEEVGTLIGFIHDKDSIIEHQAGISLGNIGEISLNPALMPPEETPLRIVVRNASERHSAKTPPLPAKQ